ncbi:MFS transporter [Acinetobacter sp. B51(2017)]|uniref:MFS transporter n=1 Tax=Acinetobacter sp. B51(2017) TaxID=2060938 RepID=UPI000F074C7D|nr:MFS transporter [Acinetobacter sp. B51(2017)]
MQRDGWIIVAGFMAAIHVGKLPPAVPVLQRELGISLVEAGILLSLVQGAGMLLALLLGSYSEKIGLKRCMLLGLLLLGSASSLAAFSLNFKLLLLLRGLEGLGFLCITLTGAAYLRHLVAAEHLQKKLGLWSAYMGGGMGIALLITPFLFTLLSWQQVWLCYGALSFALALILSVYLPAPPPPSNCTKVLNVLVQVLKYPPAWLLAVIFALYAGQWLVLVGFLPTIYQQNQISLTLAGSLTALVAISNAIGTAICGRLLQRGIAASRLIRVGFVVMLITALSFYSFSSNLPFMLQYACVVAFSLLGGLVPASVFSQAMHVAPQPQCIPATIGLTLQCSACLQFLLPPLAATLVAWTHTWLWLGGAMLILSLLALLLVQWLFQLQRLRLTNQ